MALQTFIYAPEMGKHNMWILQDQTVILSNITAHKGGAAFVTAAYGYHPVLSHLL